MRRHPRRRHLALRGGRADDRVGAAAGDGSQSPYKSNLVNGFELSEAERAFLNSLTDEDFLADPRFAAPNPSGTGEKSN